MTARDARFVAHLRRSLGNRLVDVRADVARMEGSPAGVVRPGGEAKATLYVVHHTAGPQSQTWRDVWAYHTQTLHWDTGGYHALVNASGELFLTVPPSRMTYGAGPRWNASTVHVCAIGNYEAHEPGLEMLDTIYRWLCVCDDVLGYHPWRPHGAIRRTACPGGNLAPLVYRMSAFGAQTPRPPTFPF